MITDAMRAYGLVLAAATQKYRAEGFTIHAAGFMAMGDAERAVPLSADELLAIGRLIGAGRLAELADSAPG